MGLKIKRLIELCDKEFENVNCENCPCNVKDCLLTLIEKYNEVYEDEIDYIDNDED